MARSRGSLLPGNTAASPRLSGKPVEWHTYDIAWIEAQRRSIEKNRRRGGGGGGKSKVTALYSPQLRK